MTTLQEAWRYHGVDDDQPVPEFFQYGWEASEEAHAAEIAALRGTVARLEKDAKRLDFIEKRARCDPKMDGNHVWWPNNFNHALKGPTLRAAIDAALASTKEQHD